MAKILIVADYRSQFYSSTRSRGSSLDIEQIAHEFGSLGHSVEVSQFARVQNRDCKGVYVLYQSSEDQSLHYKQYIEDVLLGLQLRGAILVPRFEMFRAHHNKTFMEILRAISGAGADVTSRSYGTFEEYIEDDALVEYPVVIKGSEGSRSRQVFLARDKQEADRIARKVSSTPSAFNLLMEIRSFIDGRGYVPVSDHRRRFIVQRFVHGLSGDFKVLVYGENYFVLFRENRNNDFRASGSGKLSFPEVVPSAVLDEAKRIYSVFNVPYVSLDIGYDGIKIHLLEFQFVQFGQYAVEKSPHRFRWSNERWELIRGTTTAESEIAASVHAFIQNGGISCH